LQVAHRLEADLALERKRGRQTTPDVIARSAATRPGAQVLAVSRIATSLRCPRNGSATIGLLPEGFSRWTLSGAAIPSLYSAIVLAHRGLPRRYRFSQ